MTPQEVLGSTSPQVKKVIEEILKIEKAHKHYQSAAALKAREHEIVDLILKAIYQEVK